MNNTRSKRGGIRARVCTESMYWHGFRLERGYIFGSHKGVELVFTGKTRPAKRRDGTIYGTQALIFSHPHVYAWEADQTVRRSDWRAEWVDCGSGVGKKFLAKAALARKDGVTIPEEFPTTSNQKFYFCSDKSRWNEAVKRSYYYDCKIGE